MKPSRGKTDLDRRERVNNRRLGVGAGFAIRAGVDANGVHVIRVACLEDIGFVLESRFSKMMRTGRLLPRRTAAGATKAQPVKSKTLLQYTLELLTEGSQILKQNCPEPMKLQSLLSQTSHNVGSSVRTCAIQ